MATQGNIWPKHITVDRRIVNILSQSTYDNFPRALKELITNSYDADATEVKIKIDLSTETVTIEDNGRGMSDSDFEFYLRIAGKTRSKKENSTLLGRHIIGQFGIGFLSIFPFFKNYSIETKKAGTSTLLSATIPLYKYFINQNKLIDIDNIEIAGQNRLVKDNPNSFTKITLQGFSDLTSAFFYSNKKRDPNQVETYSGIEKLKWILADDLPLKFKDETFNKIFQIDDLSFNVLLNGEILLRQMYGNEILETHDSRYNRIGKIKFKYCIVTPRKSVKPYAARYLKIRNLNVGVGEREHFGLAVGATRSRLHWLSGEVHILEGVNDLIKISRDNFNYSHDYEELKTFLNSRLNFYSNKLERESELTKDLKQTGKEFRITNIKLLSKKGLPQKHIVLNKKRFLVIGEKWDYESDNFPACKIEGNKVIINETYPLFQGKKHADIFIKIHVMILINYESGKISKSLFEHLNKEIFSYFSDYNK